MPDYTVEFMGIYPDEIRSACQKADEALKEAGVDLFDERYDIDFDEFKSVLHCIGNWDNITGSVITAYYICCERTAKRALGKDIEVTYYVNGDDSEFSVI